MNTVYMHPILENKQLSDTTSLSNKNVIPRSNGSIVSKDDSRKHITQLISLPNPLKNKTLVQQINKKVNKKGGFTIKSPTNEPLLQVTQLATRAQTSTNLKRKQIDLDKIFQPFYMPKQLDPKPSPAMSKKQSQQMKLLDSSSESSMAKSSLRGIQSHHSASIKNIEFPPTKYKSRSNSDIQQQSHLVSSNLTSPLLKIEKAKEKYHTKDESNQSPHTESYQNQYASVHTSQRDANYFASIMSRTSPRSPELPKRDLLNTVQANYDRVMTAQQQNQKQLLAPGETTNSVNIDSQQQVQADGIVHDTRLSPVDIDRQELLHSLSKTNIIKGDEDEIIVDHGTNQDQLDTIYSQKQFPESQNIPATNQTIEEKSIEQSHSQNQTHSRSQQLLSKIRITQNNTNVRAHLNIHTNMDSDAYSTGGSYSLFSSKAGSRPRTAKNFRPNTAKTNTTRPQTGTSQSRFDPWSHTANGFSSRRPNSSKIAKLHTRISSGQSTSSFKQWGRPMSGATFSSEDIPTSKTKIGSMGTNSGLKGTISKIGSMQGNSVMKPKLSKATTTIGRAYRNIEFKLNEDMSPSEKSIDHMRDSDISQGRSSNRSMTLSASRSSDRRSTISRSSKRAMTRKNKFNQDEVLTRPKKSEHGPVIVHQNLIKTRNEQQLFAEEALELKEQVDDVAFKLYSMNYIFMRQEDQGEDFEFLRENKKVLNEIDIQFLKQEFEKKETYPEYVNYEKIDNIVSRLKFFEKLPKPVRVSLLRSALYQHFSSDSIVFKQGDYGDLMYVILRGSVNVRIQKPDTYGNVQDVIVAFLYDGAHFGELALMGTHTKKGKLQRKKQQSVRTEGVNLETGVFKSQIEILKERAKKKSLTDLAKEHKNVNSLFSLEEKASSTQKPNVSIEEQSSVKKDQKKSVHFSEDGFLSPGMTSKKLSPRSEIPQSIQNPKTTTSINELMEKDKKKQYESNLPPIMTEGSKEEIQTNQSDGEDKREDEDDDDEDPDAPQAYVERTKRAATIQAAESCDMLCVPREQFKNIFLKLIQKELDAKLKVLMCLPFFDDLDPFQLIPIANNLTPKLYKMGDIIIRAGDDIDTFKIISEGRCRVVMSVAHEIDDKPNPHVKGAASVLKKFNAGLKDYSCQETRSRDLVAKGKKIAPNRSKLKAFDYDVTTLPNGKRGYVEHINFATYAKGDSFGGRAILSDKDYLSNEYVDAKQRLKGPAKMTVLADSAVVEILELDKEQLTYIPDFLRKVIRRGIRAFKDFDDYDIDHEIEKIQDWNAFKDKEIKNIFKEKSKPSSMNFKRF